MPRKKYLRASRASGSTVRKIEAIVRRGPRAVRRKFAAVDRRLWLKGGLCES